MEKAGSLVVSAFDREERRPAGQAAVHSVRAAGIEAAAALDLGSQVLLRWQRYGGFPSFIWIGYGDGGDEFLDIRMLGIFDHADGVTLFREGTLVEDVKIIADLVGGTQIVGDIEEGDVFHLSAHPAV